jgi:hypothetical protein
MTISIGSAKLVWKGAVAAYALILPSPEIRNSTERKLRPATSETLRTD